MPDTTTFPKVGQTPAADYYEIALVQYTEKLSKDLPATTLRGYVQIETAANAAQSKHIALKYPDGSAILDGNGNQVFAVDPPSYLGPTIVAQRDRPVRVKFTNYLPTGAAGDLFLPVDTTVMGAGLGPGRHDQLHPEPRHHPSARRRDAVDQRRHALPVDGSGRRDDHLQAWRQRAVRARHVVRRARATSCRREPPGRPTIPARAR